MNILEASYCRSFPYYVMPFHPEKQNIAKVCFAANLDLYPTVHFTFKYFPNIN